MIEGLRGFPRVMELVSKELVFKYMQSVTVGTSLTTRGPTSAFPPCSAASNKSLCYLRISSMKQHPCLPPDLTVISLRAVISLYLPFLAAHILLHYLAYPCAHL